MFMIRLLFILFIVNTAHADETQFLVSAPPVFSAQDTLDIIKYAALNRRWHITNDEAGKLRIELDHNSYKVALEFSVTGNTVSYVDFTRQELYDDDSEEESEKSHVPANWLANIKNDMIAVFPLVKNIKSRFVATK